MGYNLIQNRPMLMTHQSRNIHSLYVQYIYQLYKCETSLEQSMSYNYENNFVQTLNAAVSVITRVGEN